MFAKCAAKLKSIMKDESAQGSTEYILLLVVVVALVLVFKKPIMDAVKGKMGEVSAGMDQVKVSE